MTTWGSSLWVRWLGWATLYAVFFYVGVTDIFDVLPAWLPSHGMWANVLPFLIPALIAFLIGVRFRSWWWALGPLVVCIVPLMLLALWSGLAHPGAIPEARGWVWVMVLLGAMIGGVSALAALAGVWLGLWWSDRREEVSA